MMLCNEIIVLRQQSGSLADCLQMSFHLLIALFDALDH